MRAPEVAVYDPCYNLKIPIDALMIPKESNICPVFCSHRIAILEMKIKKDLINNEHSQFTGILD